MAKLFVKGEYYESIAPGALYEDDYERLLLAYSKVLYPEWRLVRFKCPVESPYGTAKADLALVDAKYRKWWVVEVELSTHPLYAHVAPQVQCLATGKYGEEHAEVLAGALPDLDRDSLSEMVRAEQPRVLVLVNQAMPEWLPTIRQWNGRLGVVEVFRSRQNVDILRINGEQPDDLADIVSVCRVDPLLRNSIIVSSPAALSVKAGDRVEILYDGGVSEWTRVDSGDRVWLMPVRRWPLSPSVQKLELKQDSAGSFVLIPTGNR